MSSGKKIETFLPDIVVSQTSNKQEATYKKMNTTHQMIVDALDNHAYGWDSDDKEMTMTINWSAEEVNNYLDEMVENMADEQYDDDLFPIIATRSIRKSLDMDAIIKKMDEIGWAEFTRLLFECDW